MQTASATAVNLTAASAQGPIQAEPADHSRVPKLRESAHWITRTALCVEVRDPRRASGPKAESVGEKSGVLYIFMPPLEKLHALVRWSLERLLTNEMPLLPSRNSTLRAVLMANKDYLNGLVAVSDQIGEWITQAQAQGVISPTLPPLVGLYTLSARACDPVVSFLKEGGQYSDAEIVDLVVRTCFDGLAAR